MFVNGRMTYTIIFGQLYFYIMMSVVSYFACAVPTWWVRCSAVAKSKTTMGGLDCLRGALCATFATLWIVERRRRRRLAKLDRSVGKNVYLVDWILY